MYYNSIVIPSLSNIKIMKITNATLIFVFSCTRLWALGLDPSLKLPSFNDLKQSVVNNSTQAGQAGDGAEAENIVVTFNDSKKAPAPTKSDQVSVDFIDEDIKSVLRYISELYDLNIIIPTSLIGSVSLRLKNVSWQALLDSVLSPLDCNFIEKDGIVQIGTNESLSKEPLITKTFLLKFADAKAIAEELKDFVNAEYQEKLTFNTRTNVLIWTGRGRSLEQIEEIIEVLDKPETQVMIEAKFVEADNSETDERGITWPTGLTAYLDRGTQEKASSDSSSSSSSSNNDNHGQIEAGLLGNKFFRGTSMFVRTLTAGFNFSQTDSIGKTLSNPTIITMNNVPASMSVISNYPVPNYSYNSDQGVYEISGFEEKPIGIELKVTPKVQSEFITLQLEPSLSSDNGEVTFKAGSGSTEVKYPKISKKMTNSTVTIKSGYTIAIGGLMSSKKQESISKVPMLGNLPFLGALFTNKSKTDTLSNLLIFLSATQIGYDGTILYPHQEGAKNISERRMYELGLTHKDLPGEAPVPEEESKLYHELQEVQAKLDNLKLSEKANKTKTQLYRTLNGEPEVMKRGARAPKHTAGKARGASRATKTYNVKKKYKVM